VRYGFAVLGKRVKMEKIFCVFSISAMNLMVMFFVDGNLLSEVLLGREAPFFLPSIS
jgi:hypothetical protein